MWKSVLAGLVFLLSLAAPVVAQPIPLYGHPQLEFYASRAVCPAIDMQVWLGDPDPLKATHIHVVPQACIYQRILNNLPFDIPITIKAHKLQGFIGGVGGPQVRSIRWDATGTDQLPDMTGDPNGLREWHGVATIDLTLAPQTFPPDLLLFPVHGWGGIRFDTRTYLTDGSGRYVDEQAVVPVFSLIDPSAPLHLQPEQGNRGVTLRSSATVWDPVAGALVGEVITEIDDYIPLLPLAAPMKTIVNMYNYTAPVALVGDNLFEFRRDPDLHHGVPGIILRSAPAQARRSFFDDQLISPADFGSGDHKGMVIWTQFTGAEAVSSVIVFPFKVTDGVPPPMICTNLQAPNFGGLLPCQLPVDPIDVCPNLQGVQTTVPPGLELRGGQCLPPIVVPVFTPFTPFFEQLDGVFQVCNSAAGNPRICKIIG